MKRLLVLASLAVLAACSASAPAPAAKAGGGDRHEEPGKPVEPKLPEERKEELADLEQALAAAKELDTDGLLAAHAVPFAASLPYDPAQAGHLDLVQASSLALDSDELATLSSKGFVISEAHRFPSFVYGYQAIYAEDLPLFVSADSILHAVHRSYDEVLKAVELASLIPELARMLDGMRAALEAGGGSALGDQARRDADLYLAVARGLLAGAPVAPVAGADAAAVEDLTRKALAHSGWQSVELFGVARDVDFSQYVPRGHYTDSRELTRYFLSMMWLGRIDFRIVETQSDGSSVFRRRQLEGAYALRSLMDAAALDAWGRIDQAVAVFVGEPDNMTLPELDELLADLGVADAAGLAAVSDEAIASAIVAGGYGVQRISSHIMINGTGEGTLPLSSTFVLLGQRYTIDSHVFSNVVYDRVGGGGVYRMMPDPLDVAYAALANDQAAALLRSELDRFGYAPDLESMRILADAHGAEFWDSSLYNLWLGALRELSPEKEAIAGAASGLPAVARTEPWGRRLLNAQLASWAELRHDTILYVKQSYTGGATCEFPDAYVDPYPEFFRALHAYAEKGKALVGTVRAVDGWLVPAIERYFTNLSAVSEQLADMADRQRRGEAFTAEQLAFVNRAVRIQMGCGDPAGMEGWYADLFFDPVAGIELDPTIADVHTQPTDEGGAPVGRVLHVGTGLPRLAVITADTCTGPKAYVGLASSYFERITEGFDRLDDLRWKDELVRTTPADVRWMQDLVVR